MAPNKKAKNNIKDLPENNLNRDGKHPIVKEVLDKLGLTKEEIQKILEWKSEEDFIINILLNDYKKWYFMPPSFISMVVTESILFQTKLTKYYVQNSNKDDKRKLLLIAKFRGLDYRDPKFLLGSRFELVKYSDYGNIRTVEYKEK